MTVAPSYVLSQESNLPVRSVVELVSRSHGIVDARDDLDNIGSATMVTMAAPMTEA